MADRDDRRHSQDREGRRRRRDGVGVGVACFQIELDRVSNRHVEGRENLRPALLGDDVEEIGKVEAAEAVSR